MANQSEQAEYDNRRPLRSRGLRLFAWLADGLARRGVSPNAVSVASMFFAAIGSALLVGTLFVNQVLLSRIMLLAAAGAVQLRLVCNLLDGMVADRVVGGGSLAGRLYNEAPDRVSDLLLVIGFGFLAASPFDYYLGPLAAGLAILTAYVRGLANEVGAPQPFLGPMAKPQRMALLTASLLALGLLPWDCLAGWWGPGSRWGLVESVLWVMVLGCLATSWRRYAVIARHARAQGGNDDHT